jgi:hypothetical protein
MSDDQFYAFVEQSVVDLRTSWTKATGKDLNRGKLRKLRSALIEFFDTHGDRDGQFFAD